MRSWAAAGSRGAGLPSAGVAGRTGVWSSSRRSREKGTSATGPEASSRNFRHHASASKSTISPSIVAPHDISSVTRCGASLSGAGTCGHANGGAGQGGRSSSGMSGGSGSDEWDTMLTLPARQAARRCSSAGRLKTAAAAAAGRGCTTVSSNEGSTGKSGMACSGAAP